MKGLMSTATAQKVNKKLKMRQLLEKKRRTDFQEGSVCGLTRMKGLELGLIKRTYQYSEHYIPKVLIIILGNTCP